MEPNSLIVQERIEGLGFGLEPILGKKMKNGKKILVTTATSEILVARSLPAGDSIRMYCPACSDVTQLLDPETAVTKYPITIREVMLMISTGRVHWMDMTHRHALLCVTSLAAAVLEKPRD